jgi:hypothetical protein
MPAAREIAARESCSDSFLTANADQRDFEGPFGERLRAGAHIEASVRCEPRRRRRLPEEALSEGIHHGPANRKSVSVPERPERRPGGFFCGWAAACLRGR